jgi:4-amino-4-deoxy-L-arabinose transferase-like glycosyltransferase
MKSLFPQTRTAWIALGFIGLLTLFRLWFCTQYELVEDEAYYWLWSKHPDICYFSKGPAVAWIIGAGTRLFGDTVLGIRVFAVLLASGTALGLFWLARRLYDDATALAALAIAACIPMLAVGSTLMTIDPISVFCWTWAAVAFWHAKDATPALLWAVTGALVGLGMLAKYTNIAQLLCFTFFLAWLPDYRRRLRRRRFWIMVLVALLFLLPPLVWNARHDWITLQHLVHRGSIDKPFRPDAGEMLDFLLSQMLVISPLFFLGILFCAFRALRFWKREIREVYLAWLFLPLFVFYTLLSLGGAGEANWAAPSYITGAVLLAAFFLPRLSLPRARLLRGLAVLAFALALFECAFLHGFLDLPLPPGKNPLNRVRGGRDLASQVQAWREQTGAEIVIGNKYGVASLVAFYLPDQPQPFLPTHRGMLNQFSFWPGYREQAAFQGKSALFVTDSMDELPETLAAEFESVGLLQHTYARHDGHDLKPYKIYLCSKLKSQPPEL